jgi:hypothetical protein
MGFRVESLSERVAFDLMLGRQEHQAFRTQLQAPTIPIESSPPVMQAAVEIVQQAFFGVFNSGTGGLIVYGRWYSRRVLCQEGRTGDGGRSGSHSPPWCSLTHERGTDIKMTMSC